MGAQWSQAVHAESRAALNKRAVGCCLLLAVVALGAFGAVYCKQEGLSPRSIGLLTAAGVTALIGGCCLKCWRPGVTGHSEAAATAGETHGWNALLGPELGARVARAERLPPGDSGRQLNTSHTVAAALALVRNPESRARYPQLAEILFGTLDPVARRRNELYVLQRVYTQIQQAATGPHPITDAVGFVDWACGYLAPFYAPLDADRLQQQQALLGDMGFGTAAEPDRIQLLGIHLLNRHMVPSLDGLNRAQAREELNILNAVWGEKGNWWNSTYVPLYGQIWSAYSVNGASMLLELWDRHRTPGLMTPRQAQDYLAPLARDWQQPEFEALTSLLRGRVQMDLILLLPWLGRMLRSAPTNEREEQLGGLFLDMMRSLGLNTGVADQILAVRRAERNQSVS